SGNYVSTDGGTTKDYQAVYVADATKTLTLKATNYGSISFYDKIAGADGFNLHLTGDSTGVVNLYNNVENNANLTIDNVKLNLANGTIDNRTFETITAQDGAKLDVDIDLTNGVADKITSSGTSTGTILIDSINFVGTQVAASKVYQILNLSSDSSLKLALNDSYKEVTPEISNTVKNTDLISQTVYELATTTTTNDSIKIYDKTYDALVLLNQKVTTEERNFNFVDTSTYTLTDDLGTTSAGTFNINGMQQSSLARRAISRASTSSTMSTIDLAGKRGFTIEAGTTFNITDTAIINGVAPDKGGAIYNNGGTIGTLSGKFVGNYAYNKTAAVQGGAIYNSGTITSITSDFTNNYALADAEAGYGGAIYNSGTITTINGSYTGNYTKSTVTRGGVIYNEGTITTISGTFDSNNAVSTNGNLLGGIIANYNTINNVGGTFTNNTVSSTGGIIYGGLIYNSTDKIMDKINATVNNNNISSNKAIFGGIIQNQGTIDTIDGSYDDNVISSVESLQGGIINISKSVTNIKGSYKRNSITSKTILGSIIVNAEYINNIEATFENNTSKANGGMIWGGIIFNNTNKIIDKINATVNNNNISSTVGVAGGIIQNQGTIDTIDGKYEKNVVSSVERLQGGIISLSKNSKVTNIKGVYKDNKITAKIVSGGIIANSGNIDNIEATFENNTSESTGGNAWGGVIMNYTGKTIGTINSTFKNNSLNASGSAFGGAVDNQGTITKIVGLFEGNYANSSGSAICNIGTTANIGSINADFIGNYGASSVIYSTGTIGNITGDFTSNYSLKDDSGGSCLSSFNGFVGNITGNFTENYQDFSSDADSESWGGILYFRAGNSSGVENPTETTIYTIGKISGEFTGNYSLAGTINGSGLHFRAVNSTVFQTVAEGVDGTFTGNYGVASKGSARGGVLFNEAFSTYSTVKTVTGTYKN
ncbi:MAG TPA: hypothetical protein DEF63_02790, partial [Cyanobacteria bacterium UBA11440]|nr:hypothetical protein [Cyanobacteria bacterium UBA11440]